MVRGYEIVGATAAEAEIAAGDNCVGAAIVGVGAGAGAVEGGAGEMSEGCECNGVGYSLRLQLTPLAMARRVLEAAIGGERLLRLGQLRFEAGVCVELRVASWMPLSGGLDQSNLESVR
jgi:hypothetical protein